MKSIYWRPQHTPAFAFVLIAMFSVAGIFSVEYFRVQQKRPYYEQKVEAARLAFAAMQVIKDERLRRGPPIDPETDPARSGLIGSFVTPVTSDPGNLESKQTSTNPNFAAVVVELLKRAKANKGDHVAISVSGSFPGLCISVFAACKTLDLKPTIIASASASQWGANDPQFLWIDMENLLYGKGLFPFRSAAASFGGKNDRGREMTEKGRGYVLEALKRNNLPLISAPTIGKNIDQRMTIYFDKGPPKVFINVGGGLVSTGIRPFKVFLKPGLVSKNLPIDTATDSVMQRFLREGIPVIHLGNMRQLAREFNLPFAPATTPAIGEGGIYYRTGYRTWLAAAILMGIITGLYVFSRTDWGFRALQASAAREEAGPPEPMV